MKRKFCYLYLTCGKGEEGAIAKTLLEKHLVACAKFLPVESMYWWNGKIEKSPEILIILESAEDLCTQIEAEVAKIHRYDTFVLTQVPMTNLNTQAATWLEENLIKPSRKGKLV